MLSEPLDKLEIKSIALKFKCKSSFDVNDVSMPMLQITGLCVKATDVITIPYRN